MPNFITYTQSNFFYSFTSQELSVELPWISGNLHVPRLYLTTEGKLSRNEVETLLNNPELFSTQELRSFPFCQQVPRHVNDFSSTAVDNTVFSYPDNYMQILASLEYDIDVNENIWQVLPLQSLWDIQAICKESLIEGTEQYDPVSVYTVLRRLRNEHWEFKKYSSLLEGQLRSLLHSDEPAFFECMFHLLVQSYYVTSHCTESLSPGLHCAFFNESLTCYIKEEKGHHLLILRSLKELSNDISTIFNLVTNETIALMNNLQHCAAHYPVAFCCLLGAFEQASQFESDPLADFLLESSKPSAAKGLLTHFAINQRGNHSEIGLNLVELLPPCNIAQVYASAISLELMTVLMEGIAYRILEKRGLL